MPLSAQNSSDRARQLLALTERLTGRLTDEIGKLEAHRPQDLFEGIEETRNLSNLYRIESMRVKADPGLLKGITAQEKQALVKATETFNDTLAHYERAVNAAKTVTEGIVSAIADDMNTRRAGTMTYGARGHTRPTGPQSLGSGRVA
ncbi:flagellar basal-body protein FlbY [Asticcacaulis solisilvae]|uniref:flagellar basal-body protein FlbY n=1 Tax=Asticcacaulis solisilvae TaxID=1217274 RepID=UPI003FD82844